MENKEADGLKMLKIKYQGKSVDILYDPSKGVPKEDLIKEGIEKLKDQIVKENKDAQAEKNKGVGGGKKPENFEDKKPSFDNKVDIEFDKVSIPTGEENDIGSRAKDKEQTVDSAESNENAAKAVEQTQPKMDVDANAGQQVSLDDSVVRDIQNQVKTEDEKQPEKQEKPDDIKEKEESIKTALDNERDLNLRDGVAGKGVGDAMKEAEKIDKTGGVNTAGGKAKVKSSRELVEKIAKASGVSVETLVAKQKGEKVARPKPKTVTKSKADKKGKESKEDKDNEAMRQIFLKNGRLGSR